LPQFPFFIYICLIYQLLMSKNSEEQKSLDEVYIFWLERVMKAMKRHKAQFFKNMDLDLTSDQWVLLKRCHEVQGITQKDLAESTYKDPASITRTLDLLVKKDLVERRQGNDRRNFEVWLTPIGDAMVQKILPHAAATRLVGLKGISAAENKAFIQTLEKIWKNLI